MSQHISRRWKARLFVGLAMLIMAFVGLIIMNIHSRTYWIYSQIMAFAYAIMSIGLFWYLNRGEHKMTSTTLWHQLVHWIALICAIYVTALFVSSGVIGTTQAGLITLLLLALTVFLAGVYSDPSFMLIGVTLAVFASCAALIEAYLSVFMIPVLVIACAILYFIIHHQHKKEKST